VLIDDSGDASTAARTVTFDSYPSYGNYIGGLATQPIYVQTGIGSSVSVVGDNADEIFKMDSLPPGVDFTVNGGGGTNTLDYSGWTGDVTVDLPLGYAQGLTGGISNFRNVVGGNGNNILVGDGSANVLTGGAGRNILIGGQGGGDTLVGGSGQNILLAGYTDDDSDVAALDAVMAEWAGGNAEPFDLSRVHADSLPDSLVGGGQNWFLYAVGRDQISNPQSGDILTSI
jgi:Ca2+-binding RTX toxin-like protein